MSTRQADKAEIDGGEPEYNNFQYGIMLIQITLVALSGLILLGWSIVTFDALFDPRTPVLPGLKYLLIPAAMGVIVYLLGSLTE